MNAGYLGEPWSLPPPVGLVLGRPRTVTPRVPGSRDFRDVGPIGPGSMLPIGPSPLNAMGPRGPFPVGPRGPFTMGHRGPFPMEHSSPYSLIPRDICPVGPFGPGPTGSRGAGRDGCGVIGYGVRPPLGLRIPEHISSSNSLRPPGTEENEEKLSLCKISAPFINYENENLNNEVVDSSNSNCSTHVNVAFATPIFKDDIVKSNCLVATSVTDVTANGAAVSQSNENSAFLQIPLPSLKSMPECATYKSVVNVAPVCVSVRPPPLVFSKPPPVISETKEVKLREETVLQTIDASTISTVPVVLSKPSESTDTWIPSMEALVTKGNFMTLSSKRISTELNVLRDDVDSKGKSPEKEDAALEDFYAAVEEQIAKKKEELKKMEQHKKFTKKLPSEIKGSVGLTIRKIFKPLGIYEFRRLLQLCGQVTKYKMEKPTSEKFASASVTFSNVNEAMTAYRLMSRLSIEGTKLKIYLPDFIDDDAPPSRGMLSKDKTILQDIVKNLSKNCRTFALDAIKDEPETDDNEFINKFLEDESNDSKSEKEAIKLSEANKENPAEKVKKDETNKELKSPKFASVKVSKIPENQEQQKHQRYTQRRYRKLSVSSISSDSFDDDIIFEKFVGREHQQKSRNSRYRSRSQSFDDYQQCPEKHYDFRHSSFRGKLRSSSSEDDSPCRYDNRNTQYRGSPASGLRPPHPSVRSHRHRSKSSGQSPALYLHRTELANYCDHKLVPEKNDSFNIKITESYFNLTKSTVFDLSKVFGGNCNPEFHEGWLLSVEPRKVAMLYKLLNGYRLLNSRLTVTVLDVPKWKGKISKSEFKTCENHVKKILTRYDNQTKHMFKVDVEKVLDPFSFKIEPCPTKFCNNSLCCKYHTSADKRRDPRQFFYRPAMCDKLSRLSVCPFGEACKFCHNKEELLVHPSRFLTDVCSHWYEERCCPSRSLCANAHPESPEMFYHVAWNDLFVSGLVHSFQFVAGAIRNLYKLNEVSGVPVLILTPNENVALSMPVMLDTIARRHSVHFCTVISGKEDPRGSHILLGTVNGLLKMFQTRGVTPLKSLRSLIVDDVFSIFNNDEQLTALVDLIVLVYNQLDNPERLNKVLVASDIYEKDLLTAEEVFSTEFTVVGKVKESPPEELRFSDGEYENSDQEINYKNDEKARNKGNVRESCKNNEKVVMKVCNNWSDSSGNEERDFRKKRKKTRKSTAERHSSTSSSSSSSTRSLAKRTKSSDNSYHIVKDPNLNLLWRLISPRKSQTSEYTHQFLAEEKTLREDFEQEYNVFLEVPEMHPEYETKYEQFMTFFRSQAKSEEDDPDLEEKMWSAFWIEEMNKLKKRDWEEKCNRLVEKYKVVLINNKSFNNSSHDSNAQASSQIGSLDSVLLQSLAFTSSTPKMDTEFAFAAKNSTLFESQNPLAQSAATAYSESVNACKSNPVSSIPMKRVQEGVTEKSVSYSESKKSDFNPSKVYDLVEGLSHHTGILGTALKSLFSMARRAGSHTIEAMKIFTDADNVTLLKMSSEKLKSKLKTASRDESERLSKAIIAIDDLLKNASIDVHNNLVEINAQVSENTGKKVQETRIESKSSSSIFDEIDLNLIAKATVGKNYAEIISFINSTLAYEGKVATNDEMTAIYFSVLSRHMKTSSANNTASVANSDIGPYSASFHHQSMLLPTSTEPSVTTSTTSLPPSSTVNNACYDFMSQSYPSNINVTSTAAESYSAIPTTYETAYSNTQSSPGTSKFSSDSFLCNLMTCEKSYQNPNYSFSYATSDSTEYKIVQPETIISTLGSTNSAQRTSSNTTNSKKSVNEMETWFVKQVRLVINDPQITVELFNKQLALIFAKKPKNYKFSPSDLKLASKLQQLGTSTVSREAFLSTLKFILDS